MKYCIVLWTKYLTVCVGSLFNKVRNTLSKKKDDNLLGSNHSKKTVIGFASLDDETCRSLPAQQDSDYDEQQATSHTASNDVIQCVWIFFSGRHCWRGVGRSWRWIDRVNVHAHYGSIDGTLDLRTRTFHDLHQGVLFYHTDWPKCDAGWEVHIKGDHCRQLGFAFGVEWEPWQSVNLVFREWNVVGRTPKYTSEKRDHVREVSRLLI